jgi:hypothetical protein
MMPYYATSYYIVTTYSGAVPGETFEQDTTYIGGSDPNNGWSDDSDAWDGDFFTWAYRNVTTTYATEATNHLKYTGNDNTSSGNYDIDIVTLYIYNFAQGPCTLYIQPVYNGTPGTVYDEYRPPYTTNFLMFHDINITDDPLAPGTWTWNDINNLEIKVWAVADSGTVYFGYCECHVIVNYSEEDTPGVIINRHAVVRSGESAVATINGHKAIEADDTTLIMVGR